MNNNANGGGSRRQNVFLFTCIGGILYVVPALSALYLGVVTDGWTPGFILGMAAAVLGIPNSLFAISAFGKKKHRPLVVSFAALLIVLHLVVLPQLGSWYLILSPALVLLALMIVFSGVITEH